MGHARFRAVADQGIVEELSFVNFLGACHIELVCFQYFKSIHLSGRFVFLNCFGILHIVSSLEK